jgi:hypothetical protein
LPLIPEKRSPAFLDLKMPKEEFEEVGKVDGRTKKKQ